MAQQGQPISNIVKVSVSLSATPAQGENIDSMLIIGSSAVIDVVERMRTYSGLTEVAADFSSTTPEYLAATLWFDQAPQPLSLNIGRWAAAATTAQIIGATLPAASQLITAWTAVTSGSFELLINGAPFSITGLNFGAVTNLNGVASVIQTALAADLASTTCVWNASFSRFEVTLGAPTGVGSTVSLLHLPTATGKYTFAGLPANNDTITLNGTAITFVTSGATGNQVNIGVDVPTTLASLLALLSASADVQLVKFNYYVVGSILYVAAVATGTAGNSLTTTKSGTNISVSGATLAGGGGTDVSVLSGMATTSSGAYVANGIAAESALAAVQLLDSMFSNQWYGVALLGGVDADYIAIAGYIEGSTVKHYQGCTTQEAGALTSVDTTSLPYQLKALKYKKTACQYSSNSPYAVVSYLARILTTNWSGNNTVITEMFKQEPGVVGESLNSTQLANLLTKRCNVFINYNNGTTIIQPGQSCSGDWTDTIIAADWFAIQIQTDVYNLLYTSPTKVPQTDAGMHLIQTVIEADCVAAVNNGFLAPGTWQTTGFGAISYGTYLSKGYYIYQPLIASQSPADRALRKSVPFQIAAKTAGAVHEADISVTINQ